MSKVRKYIRLRERNQITLPAEMIEGLPIEVGGFLEISRAEDNSLQLRPTELVIMNTDLSENEEELALQDSAMEQARALTHADDFYKHVRDVEKGRLNPKRTSAAAAVCKTSGSSS